ncbi:hypothetical protein BCR44DRAFT_40229 [Catenaria anguillulae PL171]|uniref:Uncharacterized protein n=1 Tax=Catenaria anguillulae PL171 TaxID=765915 RepID=A0A1Y2H6D4_9FUNG|nr:hypothetical protein BCR44DRAFT_40229 [Catenaria anguillulae PL171]
MMNTTISTPIDLSRPPHPSGPRALAPPAVPLSVLGLPPRLRTKLSNAGDFFTEDVLPLTVAEIADDLQITTATANELLSTIREAVPHQADSDSVLDGSQLFRSCADLLAQQNAAGSDLSWGISPLDRLLAPMPSASITEMCATTERVRVQLLMSLISTALGVHVGGNSMNTINTTSTRSSHPSILILDTDGALTQSIRARLATDPDPARADLWAACLHVHYVPDLTSLTHQLECASAIYDLVVLDSLTSTLADLHDKVVRSRVVHMCGMHLRRLAIREPSGGTKRGARVVLTSTSIGAMQSTFGGAGTVEPWASLAATRVHVQPVTIDAGIGSAQQVRATLVKSSSMVEAGTAVEFGLPGDRLAPSEMTFGGSGIVSNSGASVNLTQQAVRHSDVMPSSSDALWEGYDEHVFQHLAEMDDS